MDQQQPPQQIQPNYQPSQPGGQKTGMGLEPNLAAALSYLCGWLTGLIFFLVEKDNNYVKFHAMQSIIVFGSLTVISIACTILSFVPAVGWILGLIGKIGVMCIGFIAWILLMLKAYQGERFHFPVAGDIAEKQLKNA
jgi:uncharacterized membrane protein